MIEQPAQVILQAMSLLVLVLPLVKKNIKVQGKSLLNLIKQKKYLFQMGV